MKIEMRCKCGAVFIGEVNDDYERAYQDVITEADEWRKEHNRLCETVHGRNGLDKRVPGIKAHEDELHALESDVGKVIRTVNALDSRIDSMLNTFVPDREIKKQG